MSVKIVQPVLWWRTGDMGLGEEAEQRPEHEISAI